MGRVGVVARPVKFAKTLPYQAGGGARPYNKTCAKGVGPDFSVSTSDFYILPRSRSAPGPHSSDAQFSLHFLQRYAFGFRIYEEDNKELEDHHE
jgi:hypothetical protein